MTPEFHFDFPHLWSARALSAPPLIMPARSYIYPRAVAGEEDALNRGALLLEIVPEHGGQIFATCALGFSEEGALSGVLSCPEAHEICMVAGGYAYLVDTRQPERCTHLAMRPVVEVRSVVDHRLLLFAGFYSILAWGANGIAWQTPRITWEGLTISRIDGDELRGMAWDMPRDKEVPFAVDLRDGEVSGGSAP